MKNINIVIIGAGLAGVTIANELSQYAKVTVIERGEHLPSIPQKNFLKRKFGDSNTYCYGHGGTTNLWHNGLIEIPPNDVCSPFKDILIAVDKYKDNAASKLNFAGSFTKEKTKVLAEMKELINNDTIVLDTILMPKNTPALKINKEAALYLNVSNIDFDVIENKVTHLIFTSKTKKHTIPVDLLIICSGGINSPSLVEKILAKSKCQLKGNGRNFIDHPMGFIGKIKIKPIYKNIFSKLSQKIYSGYTSRTGIVIKHKGKSHIFYFRPAITKRNNLTIYKFKSKLGSSTWRQRFEMIFNKNILHPDIIQEIFSQIFKIRFVTTNFSFWAVFEQHPKDSFVCTEQTKINTISWDISTEEIEEYKEVIQVFLNTISKYIIDSDFDLTHLEQYLWSAAHHSGTCALGNNNAVVDQNLKLNSLNNVYVCDGSVIPSHSYVNTGLTIAQLSLNLCELIKIELMK